MWIVRLALRRPYTFVVAALLILIFGGWYSIQTRKEIFPNIDIPVVSVVWSYAGLTAEDFEQSITSFSEFALSSTVNGIERIESQTLAGMGLIRIYFHPGTDVGIATSQVTATSQQILRRLPPQTFPPVVLLYSPSTVPIVQMLVSSDTLTEQDLYNYASYRLRHLVAVIQGVTLPTPFGGKVRELMVDVYPEKLQARGLSPRDVMEAIQRQNMILPTGDARIGDIDYLVNANNTFELPEEYNDIPVAVLNNSIVYLRDVAFAHLGFPPQNNIVHDQDQRAVLLPVLKNGSTSILEIVDQIKEKLPSLQASAPKGAKIKLLFDQSIFVQVAIQNVLVEAFLAILLTGLLMLLFLGSWRSSLIVLVSIPLSILTSIILISWMGYSLNLMTLGGLALSIGILVDDAIVTLENIERIRALGRPLQQAILEGSYQVVIPTFVSTLAICIVFLPISLLIGPSKFLFIPFAFSVIFAILASYIWARTLIPVMMNYLMKHEDLVEGDKRSFFGKCHESFERGFHRFREGYGRTLGRALENRKKVCLAFALLFCCSIFIAFFIGVDFFPAVDANQLRLHVRVPTGTRIEVTEQIFGSVKEEIKKVIPEEEIDLITDNIGVPAVSYNLAYGDNAMVGTWDGEILISLHSSKSNSTSTYRRELRERLKRRFPNYLFYFQPGDLIGQILNFGLPTPIDVAVIGYDKEHNLQLAQELVEKISHIPGAVDVHLHQDVDAPELFLKVNRTLLSQQGLTQFDFSRDMLVSYSDSTVIAPNFWLDRKMGLPYLIAVQTPKYRVENIDELMRMPISSDRAKIRLPLSNSFTSRSELLSNMAALERRLTPAVINHYNVQPTYNVYANVQGVDLGQVASKIQKIVDEYRAGLSPGNEIRLLGQVRDMWLAYGKLGLGFIFALILIYLILVINFQSWVDPLIIFLTLPGAISGVILILFITHTPFSVTSMMGAIMSLGVATANSILLVSFANQQLLENRSNKEAVLIAATIRLRPILMTALAMIIGMIPMAIGLGAAGEENAPLGRAVIGGLILATCTTLFFIPVIFSYLRKTPNPYISKIETQTTLEK